MFQIYLKREVDLKTYFTPKWKSNQAKNIYLLPLRNLNPQWSSYSILTVMKNQWFRSFLSKFHNMMQLWNDMIQLWMRWYGYEKLIFSLILSKFTTWHNICNDMIQLSMRWYSYEIYDTVMKNFWFR